MMKRLSFGLALALPPGGIAPARRGDSLESVQKAIDRGLEWLDRTQHRDGHWDANGQYLSTMTAMGGMAF